MKKNAKKENSLCGLIIKVENIDLCRSFYRDVLELGRPVLDSNFWTEFRLDCGAPLVLEKTVKGEKLPDTESRISALIKVQDLQRVMVNLKEHGFEPLSENQERLEHVVYAYHDPEGNPFHLISDSSGKE